MPARSARRSPSWSARSGRSTEDRARSGRLPLPHRLVAERPGTAPRRRRPRGWRCPAPPLGSARRVFQPRHRPDVRNLGSRGRAAPPARGRLRVVRPGPDGRRRPARVLSAGFSGRLFSPGRAASFGRGWRWGSATTLRARPPSRACPRRRAASSRSPWASVRRFASPRASSSSGEAGARIGFGFSGSEYNRDPRPAATR